MTYSRSFKIRRPSMKRLISLSTTPLLRLALVSVFTLYSASSSRSVAAEPQFVKIVSSLPKTGSANGQATSIANGVRLAIQEVSGRVGDVRIEYEDWDDASPARGAWDPAIEAANADKAIQDSSVIAYIGPYNSGAAKISMPKLNQAGLLQISPSATWPGLTKPGLGEPNEPMVYRPSGAITFFRVVPADDLQGDVGAKWAQELGSKKVYVLHDGELYGKGVASVFKRRIEGLGVPVAGFDKIDPKAANYRSLAVRIKQSGADLVYFGGTTQTGAGQLAKDLKSAGVTSKFMAPDGCFENSFIESAGKDVLESNAYITFGGVPPQQLTGAGKIFYDDYKKTFNSEPEGYAAYGYESAKVIITALQRASTKDRPGVVAATRTIRDFPGALGTWSFDENGDTSIKLMSGNVVKGGQFTLSKVLGQ
jgi:branched-chain amino acid transport system substrate-binding protein